MVCTNDVDEDVIPSLKLCMYNAYIATVALLDSRANENIIPYNLWETLLQPELSSSTIAFQSLSKTTTTSPCFWVAIF